MQMKQLAMIFLSIAFVAFASVDTSATSPKLYAVIFGVTISETGELVSLRLDKVIDPETRSTAAADVSVPESYVSAARELVLAKRYEPKLKDGKPVEFFTWFYFDPERPTLADISTEQ